jgi:uncharacterized membrane protein YoaK (UPF0700 family)
MKRTIPVLLSVNGGYVDTAGFLALQGLFTAHVTGNFVTAGAALVFGTSGVVAKLLALPVFCLTVALVRWFGLVLSRRKLAQARALIALELLILIVGCFLAIRFGPFRDSDTGGALLAGMILVCALAVQNALHRVHLAKFPPTTLMTGNTTQIMIDLVDLAHGSLAAAERGTTLARLTNMISGVLAFAVGCAAAAAMFFFAGVWCFALPPLLVLAALAFAQEGGAKT